MKGGVGWHMKDIISDVSVSRNWYKTVSKLYENSYICNFV